MIETSFAKWRQFKEESEVNNLPAGYDPFTTLRQKQGDIAYFGVHDLSNFYRQNGQLPNIDDQQILPKSGEIVNADPINQTITVATFRSPFHYGYHKIENEKAKQKRKVDDQGRILVTLPVTHLQDISHMVSGAQANSIWLVVDNNTKYQQDLMKEIRRKEIERSHAQQMPANNQQMPNQQLPPQGGYDDMSMAAQHTQPQTDQQTVNKYKMVGRQVMPNLQVAHYDPSILSNDRYWKRYTECKYYGYVKS